ncbi:hypothetical protein M885DRAFT_525476 [Pelagophyceae sp. CCMP2097]|nr:hypothetical protein M885DRAFT_525476 [Pelagophyceae sp. CCMP2097]
MGALAAVALLLSGAMCVSSTRRRAPRALGLARGGESLPGGDDLLAGAAPPRVAMWLLQHAATASEAEFGGATASLAAQDADALSLAMGLWACAQRPPAAAVDAYVETAAKRLATSANELAALPRGAEALTNTARALAAISAKRPDRPAADIARALDAIALACGGEEPADGAPDFDARNFCTLSRSLAAARGAGVVSSALPFGERSPRDVAAAVGLALAQQPELAHLDDFSVRRVDDFISAEDAAELISLAEPLWQKSLVDGDSDSYRTSETASLRSDAARASDAVQRVREKAARLCGLKASHCETLQLVRYSSAAHHYGAHCDLLDDAEQLLVGGQRVATVLAYVSVPDGESGGETRFEALDVDVRPTLHAALAWANVDARGAPDLRSRHAALKLTAQTASPKIAVNCWIRAFPSADQM